jgi:hypothetical protein
LVGREQTILLFQYFGALDHWMLLVAKRLVGYQALLVLHI